MTTKKTDREKGILAFVFLTMLFASVGIFIRYLGHSLTILQQVYLRLFAALVFSIIFFRKDLHLEKLKLITLKEWLLLFFRSIAWYGLGVTLFSISIIETKYSNVSFIGALPFTALLGFLLFREKITLPKIIFIIAAFSGVILIGVKDYSSLFKWGHGEILALVSTFFFAATYITRRNHTKLLSNKEITVIIFFISFILLFITSLFIDKTIPVSKLSTGVVMAVLITGLFNVGNIFLTNYGFEHVEAVLASNLLSLESVFAVILGFVFYKEVPLLKEFVGGIIILMSVIGMNYSEKKNENK